MPVFIVDNAPLGTPASGTIHPQKKGEINPPIKLIPDSINIINSASVLPSKPENTINLASTFNAETAGILNIPVTLSSESVTNLNAPVTLSSATAAGINIPVVMPSETAGTTSVPNVLTPNALPTEPYPLSNARILYDNLFNGAVTSIVSGQGLTNPNTFERWVVAGASQTMTVTANTNQTINAIALGAHNLGSMGATVQVLTAASEGGAFTSRGTITPSSDKSILILLPSSLSVRQIRVIVTNGDGSEIGVLYAGIALAMERPIFGGHAPIYLNAETTYSNNASETGNWLGRTIVRNGYSTSYKWQFLNDEWYRDNFEPFVVIARKKPFFIAWRPDIYPDEVAYCWLTGDPKPTNRGGGTKFMEVSIDVQGYADR